MNLKSATNCATSASARQTRSPEKPPPNCGRPDLVRSYPFMGRTRARTPARERTASRSLEGVYRRGRPPASASARAGDERERGGAMDGTRTRRTRDRARQTWYAGHRQWRFARWLGFGTAPAPEAGPRSPRMTTTGGVNRNDTAADPGGCLGFSQFDRLGGGTRGSFVPRKVRIGGSSFVTSVSG
jgi:hypothetical protein